MYEDLINETRTIILYEAPHHLKSTLAEMYARLGDRKIAICRELTKKFEEVIRMRLCEALDYYNEHEPKGEFVLILEGRSREEIEEEKKDEWSRKDINEHMAIYEAQGYDRKEAMKKVAADRGVSKREIYKELI